MEEATSVATSRYWRLSHAFDDATSTIVTGVTAGALIVVPIVVVILQRRGAIGEATRGNLWARYWTWLVIAPLTIGAALAGALPFIVFVGLATLAAYREFARATGLFRERFISFLVGLAIVLAWTAAADHYYLFFVALPAMSMVVIAGLAVLQDRPQGYLQRVSLAIVAFLLFGASPAHLGLLAMDSRGTSIVCLLIFCVQMNDIFAYVCGKSLGRTRLFPNSSPNKTLAGHLGAIVLTTPITALLAHWTFRGTILDEPRHLIALGLLVSIGGQLGDLILSSIKRDLGVKDLAMTLPGHGGITDRLNSFFLVAPASFHYINHVLGVATDVPARAFTGA